MLNRILGAMALAAVCVGCDRPPLNDQVAADPVAGPSLAADHTGRNTVLVNPDANGNGVAATIQEGIDMVSSGGTVKIRPGTYDETVLIEHGVTLEPMAEGEVLLAPQSTAAPAILITTAEPVVVRGLSVRHLGPHGVRATGTTDVTLEGMTIVTGPPAASGNAVASVNDPTLIGNYTGGQARFTLRNSTIDGNQVTDLLPHPQGFAIRIGGEVTALIEGNRIAQTGGACIFVLPRANLSGVTNAEIRNNDLDRCFPSGRVSSILVGTGVPLPTPLPPITYSGTVDIIGNTIRNSTASCQIGAAISYEIFTGRIEQNHIEGFVQGCAPATARNLQGAIWVGTLLPLPGTASPTVRFNDLGGNAWAGIRIAASLTSVIDARCNWWGAADGPSGVGSGSGDALIVQGAAPVPTYYPYATAPIAGTGATGC